MIQANTTRSERIGLTLACIGGAAAVLQAFLAWERSGLPAPFRNETTYTGGQTAEGLAIAWLGVAVLALGAGWGMRSRLYDVSGWLLAFGILIGVLAAQSYLSRSSNFADATGGGYPDVAGLGLYVAVASGLLIALGAVLAVRGHRD